MFRKRYAYEEKSYVRFGGGTDTLMCSEVWGGNRKIVRAVRLPSITA